MLPGEAEGYKTLGEPPGYEPIRTPARKLMATPTPFGGTPLYQIPEEDRGQKFDVPQALEGLPDMKPEDQQYFGKLLKVCLRGRLCGPRWCGGHAVPYLWRQCRRLSAAFALCPSPSRANKRLCLFPVLCSPSQPPLSIPLSSFRPPSTSSHLSPPPPGSHCRRMWTRAS